MTENHDPALPSIGDSRTPKTTGDLDGREMLKEMNPDTGFQMATPGPRAELKTKIKSMPVCSRSRIGQHGRVKHSS